MKVPTVVAIFVVMTSIYLVLAPIIHYPRVEFLYAALFIASGLFLYFPFVYYKQCRLPLDPYIGKWVTCESLKFTNTCANLSDKNIDWKNWNKPPNYCISMIIYSFMILLLFYNFRLGYNKNSKSASCHTVKILYPWNPTQELSIKNCAILDHELNNLY